MCFIRLFRLTSRPKALRMLMISTHMHYMMECLAPLFHLTPSKAVLYSAGDSRLLFMYLQCFLVELCYQFRLVVGWLDNGPLRQYFSLYQAVSQREREKEKRNDR